MMPVRQYGVQIVWIDPKAAGADPDKEPRWAVFDTLEQADGYAAIYLRYLDAGPHNGVKEVNRAERWAIEIYGKWRDT